MTRGASGGCAAACALLLLAARIREAAPPRPAGRVEILAAELEAEASELVVELAAELTSGQDDAAPLVAHLALFESGLVTRVAAGENARRTLENDYVVRFLSPAIGFETGRPERRERLRIGLDPDWAVDNLGLAAFLQDSETLEIHAAALLDEL